MTTKELLSLEYSDFNAMNERELRKIVAQLNSTANKRIKRLQKADTYSYALAHVEQNLINSKFQSTGKENVNELRSKFANVKNFLNMKTSTVSGARIEQKKISERIGGNLSPNVMREFWRTYKKLEEMSPNFTAVYGSERMQQFIRNEIVSQSEYDQTQIIENALNEINRDYLESVEENEELDEFFGL